MNKLGLSEAELAGMTPQDFRQMVRSGEWRGHSRGVCRGYAQANLAIVPKDYAFEFLLFCHRNPRPCPVIDVTELGNPHPKVATEADLRTDLPFYRVFKNGELVAEPTDIKDYWRDDLVAFLLGCSLSFEWLLEAVNIKFRLLGVFTTNIQCVPAGPFRGPMVVTCRLFKCQDVARVIQITSRNPAVHGPPVHIGNPSFVGIKNLRHADLALERFVPPEPDEILLFWGCGRTISTVAMESKIPLMITHGHALMIDKLTDELAVL